MRTATRAIGSPATDLIDLLRDRSRTTRGEADFTFMADGETVETTLTYGELDRRARAIAAALLRDGGSGERVLLLFAPGLDYLAAFFGCIYAGAIAVPTYLPRRNRPLARLQAIRADCDARFALDHVAPARRARRRLPARSGTSGLALDHRR